MKRGEVWWARLPAPAGRRPVVLVSRDAAYSVRAAVTVVEVSTTIREIDSEVPLGTRDGLPRNGMNPSGPAAELELGGPWAG
jgi:mRNA-degrading endonuclease toxin of MazEF toxin-antitoxin module